jgi:phospholipase C
VARGPSRKTIRRMRATASAPDSIRHLIVLMLENRSFDHLLAYSGIAGLKGVDTKKTNPGPSGTVAMSPSAPDRALSDPGHEFEDVDWQIFRSPYSAKPRPVTLDGFVDKGGRSTMQCASSAQVPVFTHLARKFLVCDQWFSSMPGPTWPNRFFVHAGSSGGLSNSPSNLTTIGSMLWSKLGFSFQHGTIFDRLAKAKRTWRVYHGDHFPQVCAINTMPSVFVASTDKFRPQRDFARDAARGDLPHYSFIEPDYGILTKFANGNSQHPVGTLSAGEALLADVTQALVGSPVWPQSLLLVLYDEHGGFYDQLPPPAALPPGDAPRNTGKAANPPELPFGFDRYGIRIPAIVVSPWVSTESVSHAPFDHASVVRTVFDLFGIPGSLTERDRIATSLRSALLREPTKKTPEPLPKPPKPEALSQETAQNAPESIGALNGFTRIAATVQHALKKFEAHMGTGGRLSTFGRIFHATDDLSYLPDLPHTSDPDESRAYIARVARELEAHRARQLQNG